MKLNDSIGIFHHMEQLNPDVIRAQRIQELKDIAEWRARRMKAYREWVEPANVAYRQLKHEEDALAALERGKALARAAELQMDIAKAERDIRKAMAFKLTPFTKKASTKIPWWIRILNFFLRR